MLIIVDRSLSFVLKLNAESIGLQFALQYPGIGGDPFLLFLPLDTGPVIIQYRLRRKLR